MSEITLTLEQSTLEDICRGLAKDTNYHHALGDLLWAGLGARRMAVAQKARKPGMSFVEGIAEAKEQLVEEYLKTLPPPPTPVKGILGRPGRRKLTLKTG